MDFFTRCWKKPDALASLSAILMVCLLLGCGRQQADSVPSITVIALDATTLAPDQGAILTLNHDLSADVLDALQHGISVTFQWQLERRQPRSLLWDSLLWDRSGERQISYRSLSRRFTLTQPASGMATSFRDLPTLLAALNQVEIASIPNLPAADDSYYQARARLVISRLPPALRLSSYLSDQWRMDTGWVQLAGASSTVGLAVGPNAGPAAKPGETP